LQREQPFKIICREGKLDSLLAELAVHRLDLVLSDTPLPPALSVNAYNHRLGGSSVGFYASHELAERIQAPFPQGLDDAPMLMPGSDSALGVRLAQWLGRQKLRPRVISEVDDGALAKELGKNGHGVFLAPMVLDEEVRHQYGAQLLGEAPDLIEEFYVITVERRITHPGVATITEAARKGLFAAWSR
jgi:LysR family transcriptional regulator, transcriptional activator of nhaA